MIAALPGGQQLSWLVSASLFGTVIYSEGLYLLFSTAALRAFDKQQYAFVALVP